MRYTDIAIIGGGLSGSTAAAMLGRAGISTVLIDPHESYPADFRVEKLSGHVQVERFLKTGIAESVLRRATFAGENWIARFGRLLDKAPSRQFNILYDSLVNAVRDEIPATVERVCAKALAVETSPERQRITLANGETISARPGRARQRPERRPAPPARHRPQGRQRLPFDLDRVRRDAGRSEFVRLPGADLFLGAAERPHPLHLAVSGRHADARQSVRLPKLRRSLAARAAPCTR
ncbi:choline dehydrogenase-like flavoprotein [Bradyrhizobium diazoefficiens]